MTNGTPTRNTSCSASVNASSTLPLTCSGSAWIAWMFCVALPDGGACPDATAPANTSRRCCASRLDSTAPKTAVPIAPPMDRKKVTALVAVPMSRKSTEFCTATMIVCMVKPRPAPKT